MVRMFALPSKGTQSIQEQEFELALIMGLSIKLVLEFAIGYFLGAPFSFLRIGH